MLRLLVASEEVRGVVADDASYDVHRQSAADPRPSLRDARLWRHPASLAHTARVSPTEHRGVRIRAAGGGEEPDQTGVRSPPLL